jgi:hypothetical protein
MSGYVGDEAIRDFNRNIIAPIYTKQPPEGAGVPLDADYPIWSGRAVYTYTSGQCATWAAACDRAARELRAVLGVSEPEPTYPLPTSLRVESRRIRTEAGIWGWHGITEFDGIYLVLNGLENEWRRRLERAATCQRTGVRVLGMAKNLFALSPAMPGYADAVRRMAELARDYGQNVELCAFADAQDVMPDPGTRLAFAYQVKGYCEAMPWMFPSVANEAYKNGWSSSTDPALKELAKAMGALIVSDPPDLVTNPDTADPLKSDLTLLSGYSPILVIHAERKGKDTRFAAWVDHLKGFDEVGQFGGCAKMHQEPMGAASVYQDGKRDNRPLAHLAASLVCATMGIGFTYHYIASQDDATPGLDLCAAARLIPQTPDYQFRNAGTGGAIVTSFDGYDKIRCCDNGQTGYAVGYGHQGGKVEFASGWTAKTIGDWEQTVDGEPGRVTLWQTVKG